jgi:hypothetical protein
MPHNATLREAAPAHPTPSLPPSPVAHATPPHAVPLLGHSANFCPGAVDTSASARDGQLSTAVHELLHALGFSSSSWPLFRDTDGFPGTPRTPREADGLPARTTRPCTDGSTASNVLAIGESTLVVKAERGNVVNKIVTPRVVSVARDVFGCDSLDGVEVCCAGAAEGCAGAAEGCAGAAEGAAEDLAPRLGLPRL